ncbi:MULTISPECIES: SRPBCC family protein [unclassified Streptomyces]|uniref:SRPBCC family protein n=1 Tax=unclassified Streptomyces TaxID=2593676 RepID=UPI001E415D7F|nr:SRPBCC family protein [Streptomyces sp. CB02980]MCB8901232.1 SRPBCC family protein [Streptomyces sp. CB02980]
MNESDASNESRGGDASEGGRGGLLLDDVRRMHVMVAGVRGARLVERVLPAPLPRVWQVMSDLEGGFGEFQPDMRSVRILRRDGDRVEALARSRYGLRAHFHGVLRPGWCWLQSRFLVIGMAAVEAEDESGHTRVALTGGVRVPGRAALVPFGARRELEEAMTRLAARVR